MTELKITQADRDAAEPFIGWHAYDHSLVQAFARHRIAAEEGKAELVEENARLRAYIEKTSDDFAYAVQSDCENGVRWLNERAAAAYLKDAPATLKAIQDFQDGYYEALGETHDN